MNRTMPLYQAIAHCLMAIENCKKSGNSEWLDKHQDRLDYMIRNHLPSGSGIDNGSHLYDTSSPDRLVIACSYHHMDESGYYNGWTEHEIIVTPSLAFGLALRITGRDRNDIKEYLHEVYESALTAIVDPYENVKETAA